MESVVKFRLLSVVILFLICAGSLRSQFIDRDEFKGNTGYMNYSGRNYENYSIQFLKRKIYDNFGNFLVDGLSVYELGEAQSQFVDPRLGGSDVQKSKYYNLWFNNLVIGNDAYGGFSSRVMLGDAIRTKFTSLTLDKARFNGIRWDGSSSKYRGSLIASRVSDPIRIRFDASLTANSIARPQTWSAYLLGGHFETDVGDVLTVGATYVNQNQRRSNLDSKEQSLKGVPANTIPRVIFIRVRDDSPYDNSGPIIYREPEVYINGVQRPLANINYRVPDQASRQTDISKPVQYWVFRDFGFNKSVFVPGVGVQTSQIDPSTGKFIFKNFTNYDNYRSQFGSIAPPAYPVEVRGNTSTVYAFVVPYGTESASFNLLLANDYCLDAAHDWVMAADQYGTAIDPKIPSSTDSSLVGTPTPFFTVERANGNVQDASNKRWVRYDYGLNTGMAVYGMNFKFHWLGFELEGEYAQSVSYRKYPVMHNWDGLSTSIPSLLTSNEFQREGAAFFIRGSKKIGRLVLGGERYHIDPWYTTALNVYTLENSFYTHQDANGAYIYDPPDYYGYFDSDPNRTTPNQGLNGGAYYSLVDDNDDNDRWEDGFYFYNASPSAGASGFPNFPRNTNVLSVPKGDANGTEVADPFLLGYRQNVNELSGLNDIVRKPDAGIFPGRDKNNDGIPDDDQNSNGVPDYAEDFLTYYSDPPSFQAGDDWNNNGIIDEQENDIYPDYPYNPDLDGYHGFAAFAAAKNLTVGVGVLHEIAIARGGFNASNYFKTTYNTSSPRFGALDFYYTLKRSHDNIPNDEYVFSGLISSDPTPTYVRDGLAYRNSLAHTLYIGTRYRQIPNLNIENNVRYEFNKQYIVGFPSLAKLQLGPLVDEQFGGDLTSIGLVNKVDYVYAFLNNKIQLRPQFKIRTLKVVTTTLYDDGTRATSILTDYQQMMPIFRVDYRLTDNTDLHFGLQGVDPLTYLDRISNGYLKVGSSNFLLLRNRNLRDGSLDNNSSTTAISLTNKTQYSGYNIVIDFGFKLTTVEYIRVQDKKYDMQNSLLFFSIFAGY